MSQSNQDRADDRVLDDAEVGVIGEAIAPLAVDAGRRRRLRDRIMAQIDPPAVGFETLRGGEGEWIELAPQVEKKTLMIDEDRGIESYLVRMQPGARVPEHKHHSDELCYVVEGDLRFGDIELEAGDYHFAHAGSVHGEASTINGTLLFLQSGVEARHHGG